ncbi:MAG: hypothetical protein ACAI38_11990 [Myxococcota bacterium]|nr:hypothetical protein [Myxococcota bacterium]
MAKDLEDSQSESELLARRALLKLGVYVAPAIVGTLMLSSKPVAAQASCGPQACKPAASCGPTDGTPCAPNRR